MTDLEIEEKYGDLRHGVPVTADEMYNFITDTEEFCEILVDLVNGDYSVEALQDDISEWRDFTLTTPEEDEEIDID